MPKRIILAFGTRPEATKMAPVYWALKSQPGVEPLVLLTGQHREQLQQALALFKVPAAANLDVMTERQTLPGLAARIIPAAAKALGDLKADYVLVHGDTLSTFAVAWAAFLEGIPVGHVEAGLRSGDLAQPFPEEANRRLTDVLADLYLAPTAPARANLLAEGIAVDRILVTGQTAVDAIRTAVAQATPPAWLPSGPLVLVTMHRRENWPHLARMAGALRELAERYSKHTFVYPVHLNPVVREAVRPVLAQVTNFRLVEPLEYGDLAALLARSDLIVTDSGGLQEEGAALGIPVVVLRDVTERPEGLETGILKLAGTDPERIVAVTGNWLDDAAERARLKGSANPYGDGHAAARIAQGVAWRLGLEPRPADWTFATSEP